jgi:hypothetical protein
MLCRLRAWLGRAPALIAALVFTSACGYTSQYVAPQDGRVRPVWQENKIVVEPSGAPLSAACLNAAMAETNTEFVRAAKGSGYEVRRSGYWVPRYYGPPIVVATAGVAPALPHPPVFLPSLVVASALRPRLGGVSVIPGPVPIIRIPGGSSGGGKDGGYVLLVLAVLALTVLPVIDLALAIAPAESAGRSAQAIDQVNALNDLMRMTGSPCSYETLGGAR